jgi:hypothetical protein
MAIKKKSLVDNAPAAKTTKTKSEKATSTTPAPASQIKTTLRYH